MSSNRVKVLLAPAVFKESGCLVYILEIVPYANDKKLAVVRIECGNVKTKVFNLPFTNAADLKNKLKIEVSKIKALKLFFGEEKAKEILEAIR